MNEDEAREQQFKRQVASQPIQRDDKPGMDDKILDLEAVKKEIRESLSGERYVKIFNKKEQKYEIQKVKTKKGRRLCNDKAVEDFMATIDGTVNLNIAGSYLSKKDIEAMGRKAMYALIDQIAENHDDYDIESIAAANQIVSILHANLKGAIKKAAGGRILKHGEEQTERRIVQTSEDKDDGNILTG